MVIRSKLIMPIALTAIILMLTVSCSSIASERPNGKTTTELTLLLSNSPTPTITHTIISSNTPIPSYAPTLSLTLTKTPTPLPTKSVLISYGILGGDVGDEIFECLLWRYENSFVLYEDGQLVILGNQGLETTTLSFDQVERLITQIERTGYFEIEGTGELRENDPIYEIDQSIQVGDGAPYIQITVNDKTVSVYTPIEEYVIKPISDSIEIIRSFQPSGLVQYEPENIMLLIWRLSRPPEEIDWQIATPIPPTELWPSTLPPLDNLLDEENLGQQIFIEEQAGLIRDFYPQFPSGRIFNYLDQKYYIAVCPILP